MDLVLTVLKSSEQSHREEITSGIAKSKELTGSFSAFRAVVDQIPNKCVWLGKSAEEQALVEQWIAVKDSDLTGARKTDSSVKKVLEDLDVALKTRSFLATENCPSVADYFLFFALKDHVIGEMIKSMPSMCRWFNYMQHKAGVRDALGRPALVKFQLPDAWSLLGPANLAKRGLSTDTSKAGPGKLEVTSKDTKPAAAKTDAEQPKKEKTKKQKKKPEAAPVAAAPDQPEITKLDIRVGLITKCWKHEDSDKLFCEEIDLGEGEPRSIASGLASFYSSPSDLENRKVLVLANLKARNIAGFKSHGMVLCASNDDKTKVELVNPGDAKVGERVEFEGLTGGPFDPFEANKVAKKKVFESVAPSLKTDANCCPVWEAPDGTVHKFITSAGPCSVPSIAGGTVS